MSAFSLEGKICCITGAGRGIGFTMAKALSEYGAFVIGVDLDFPLEGYSLDHKMITNLANLDEITNLVEDITGLVDRIDVLVNCAGVTIPSNGDWSILDWNDTYSINVNAPFLLTTGLIPLLERPSSSSVINITSINSFMAFPGNPAYVSSKSALDGLTRSLSLDLGERNIRVNSIAPGYIRTKMTSKSWEDAKLRKERTNRTVLGRWGEPEDLVGALIFLSSDASLYVTGHSLKVDGGWTIKGL